MNEIFISEKREQNRKTDREEKKLTWMFPALLKMEIKTLNPDALTAREFAITARGV